ncbi:MAG: putative 4-hydroxybenzoate polyprenyltransferase [Vampirovibrio sp.]|nr:putative 4-hydroxybenzoate polyprenyltransferase [Vampirovibrio sp.]
MDQSPSIQAPLNPLNRLAEYAELVKFEHTVFALPFALSAMILAPGPNSWPNLITLCWVLLAMVGGRTYAMAVNRLLDAAIDAKNPRTQDRAIPAGRVSMTEGIGLTLMAAGLFTFATFQLPLICQLLLPVAFFILTLYSIAKRFTSLCHLILGVALGSSAVGGWLAVTGEFSWLPVIFGFAVVFWVAGFDIIYACQDTEFDATQDLHSIPVRYGLNGALWISKGLHTLTVLFLVLFGLLYPGLGPLYWLAITITTGILLYEHWLVRPKATVKETLAHVDAAFFTLNGRISVLMFALILFDKFL